MSKHYKVISGLNDAELEIQINALARHGYEVDHFATSLSRKPAYVTMHTVIMARKE